MEVIHFNVMLYRFDHYGIIMIRTIGCDDVVINLKHDATDSNKGVIRMYNKVEARGLFILRKITYFRMSVRSISYFEQHFLFSYRLVQLITGLHYYQSSYDQLYLFCVITVFLSTMILYQFHQLLTSDLKFQSNLNILQKTFIALFIMIIYSGIYFSFSTIKIISIHLKFDYEHLLDIEELSIFQKYTKECKLYTIIMIGLNNLYTISVISPSILNIFQYIFGTLEDIQLILLFPVNYVLNTDMLMKIRIPFERNQNYIPRISYSGTSQKELDWIVDIIKRYIRVTKLVSMFQLSEILLNISKTIECGIYIAGSLLVTYLICYIGQMLINHNSTVLEELCQIPFYVLSEKTQKLLLFVIARSMRPCQISTNDIFVVSHELFANVSINKLLIFNALIFTRGLIYFERHYLFSNRLVQLLIGFRPSQSLSTQLLLFCMIIVFLFPMIAHQFYQLYTSDVTLHSAIKVLQNMLASLCFMITYSTIFFNFETMKSIYAHFKFDYMQLSDENELNIFEKYTKQSKIYTYCFIDKSHLKLPFSINGVTTPGVLYYSLLIYQTIAIYILITIANVCYTSYLTFVQHACCQLSILKLKIRQPFLNKKTYSQKTWLNKKNEEFNWIVDIIMRHRRVTKFVYLLNYLSKITYIIVISFAMFLIVLDLLNIFQLTAILRNIGELMECSFYIVGSLFNIYINFYIGQTLINHSNAAFEELRQVPFYILSTKTQKLLLTITLRSMKPCMLSIGGIFISSYEVFSAILEKAFSFAMVFYNVH
ncbi:LOW QUALITY PROTEIN: hypothetical protein V1477_011528 [Vespula maculifrons]|uniref:Uncharacterized protein n=1 Tax=Vespula maculifrons TaxID=7453 RepID=A0ABD2BZJ3_VESMC